MSGRRGMILSLAIVILVILLVLATGVTSMGTHNLNLAYRQLGDERAYQAAEAGLARACADLSLAKLRASDRTLVASKVYESPKGSNLDAARVEIFDNRLGTTPQPNGCPVKIPAGYLYLVSDAQLRSGKIVNRRSVSALVALGGGGGLSYGVNCHSLKVNQGVLTAYDLSRRSQLEGYPTVACRTTGPGDGKVQLGDGLHPVTLTGDLFLSPEVKAAVLGGHYTMTGGGTVRNAVSPLLFPLFTIPVLPEQPGTSLPHPQGGPAAGEVTRLPEGHYAHLDIAGPCTLQGRYVVDSLRVASGGSLSVSLGQCAEVYVSNLALPPQICLLHSGSSNHFKIFYQGRDRQSLHLGPQSHLCFVAPAADLLIEAGDLTLGSFVGHDVEIRLLHPRDRFCYDPTAAQPVGVGSPAPAELDPVIPDYQALTVMGRWRPR